MDDEFEVIGGPGEDAASDDVWLIIMINMYCILGCHKLF